MATPTFPTAWIVPTRLTRWSPTTDRSAAPERGGERDEQQAEAYQSLCGRTHRAAAEQIEQASARPTPQREVGEQRVQRVTEPLTTQQVAGGAGTGHIDQRSHPIDHWIETLCSFYCADLSLQPIRGSHLGLLSRSSLLDGTRCLL